MVRAFVDTNVFIDLLQAREFDLDAVYTMLSRAENGDIELMVSESVITNALYVSRLPGQVLLALKIFRLICIHQESVVRALGEARKDPEDAILYYGALRAGAHFFISRNKKDFLTFMVPALPVVSPREFIAHLSNE